jgi:hypothetical protein
MVSRDWFFIALAAPSNVQWRNVDAVRIRLPGLCVLARETVAEGVNGEDTQVVRKRRVAVAVSMSLWRGRS